LDPDAFTLVFSKVLVVNRDGVVVVFDQRFGLFALSSECLQHLSPRSLFACQVLKDPSVKRLEELFEHLQLLVLTNQFLLRKISFVLFFEGHGLNVASQVDSLLDVNQVKRG
jgi:hypothetical protein